MTIHHGLPGDGAIRDVCVVGAGPLGIAVARECEELGLSVLLLESGGSEPSGSRGFAPSAEIADRSRHAPLEIAICSALGGSSWWWGGRCLPLDSIDYEYRDFVPESGWPISRSDLLPFEARAAYYLDCGSASFSSSHPAWASLAGGVQFSALERWSRTPQLAKRHRQHLRASRRIDVCLNTSVLSIAQRAGQAMAVTAADQHAERSVEARSFVLACGGLLTTQLLQRHQQSNPAAFGGRAGALGHYYMGHLSGQIADIMLSDPRDADSIDFFMDKAKVWVRRRITIDAQLQRQSRIMNTAFWANNPPFHDYRHGSGILSAVYLALSVPKLGRLLVAEGIRRMHVGQGGNYARHSANVLRNPGEAIFWAWRILKQRYFETPRRPGFLIRNRTGRYALTYHAEHAAPRESAVAFHPDLQESGQGKPFIDLRFTRIDAESVVSAHEIVDDRLRSSGKGRLDYYLPRQQRVQSVLAQATDGYHQEGLLRMGIDAQTSVVDSQCKVHGFGNLYVASTGVFPTSGQANPTFTACALAIRLAHHIAKLGKGAENSSPN